MATKVELWSNRLGWDVGRNAEIWKLHPATLKETVFEGLYPFRVRVFPTGKFRGEHFQQMTFRLPTEEPTETKLREMVADCRRFGVKVEE